MPSLCRTTATTESSYFLTVFGRPEGASVCECERVQTSSLAQSLYLMNGRDIKQKLGAKRWPRRTVWPRTRGRSQEKITELYLVAYSRQPNAEEMRAASDYLAKSRVSQGKAARFPEGRAAGL